MSLPILDPGAPESFGGYETARELAQSLSIPFHPKPIRGIAKIHAFGPDAKGGGKTTHEWHLKVCDLNDRRISLRFDLIPGDSPLLVGLDYDRDAVTDTGLWVYRKQSSGAITAHPFATSLRRDLGGSLRRFLELNPAAADVCLLAKTPPSSARSLAKPAILARKLHGYSHAPLEALRQLTKRGGIWTTELDKHLKDVVARCATCPGTGSNVATGYRKVSLTKFGKDVNEAVQLDHADLTVSQTPLTSVKALIILCERARYSESPVVQSTNMASAIDAFSHAWLYCHGAPVSVSGDPAFSNKPWRRFCDSHSIRFVPKPARRHNSQGLVERRIGVLKGVLERLVAANDSLPTNRRQSAETLIAKANFLCNITSHRHFGAEKNLSAYELFRGRSPSILGLRSSLVSADLLAAFDQLEIQAATDRLLTSRSVNPYRRKPHVKPNDIVYAHVQRRPGSGRDAVGWTRHQVVRATDDFVETRPEGENNSRARTHTLAWADVRPIPQHPLSQEILAAAMEADPSEGSHAESASGPAEDSPRDDRREGGDALLGCVTGSPLRDVPFARASTPPLTSLEHDERRSENFWCKQIIQSGLTGTLSRAQLAPIVPNWVLDNALDRELAGWDDAVEVAPTKVFRERYARRLQIIGSHVIYKIKEIAGDGDVLYSLKARIVLHGNREEGKENLRADARSSSITVIRTILSVAAILRLELAHVDATAAYLQSGACPRLLFVKPPLQWSERSSGFMLWRLIKLPYGIRDAGRQWYLALEVWLLQLGFEQFSLPELFILTDDAGKILILVGRVVDDLLIAGRRAAVTQFLGEARQKWSLGTCACSTDFRFNGARISVSPTGIKLSMEEYCQEKLLPFFDAQLKLTPSRRKETTSKISSTEANALRSMAGTLLFMGVVSPPAQFTSSIILQKLPTMTVADLLLCTNMARTIANDAPNHVFYPMVSASVAIQGLRLIGFSDASLNLLAGNAYGQGASFIGLVLQEEGTEQQKFYFLESHSARLKRIVHSSFGAEILAATETESRLHALREALREIIPELSSDLFTDSRGLFECLTTLASDNREYRLRNTVTRLRDSFESGDTDRMNWIPGVENYADSWNKIQPSGLAPLVEHSRRRSA